MTHRMSVLATLLLAHAVALTLGRPAFNPAHAVPPNPKVVSSTGARGPKVHPLSAFSPAIGARAPQPNGPTLTAQPDVVSGKGGMVTVSWSNYPFIAKTDWVGLFCPEDGSPYAHTPIKFRWMENLTAAGSFDFYVDNYRQNCRFYLMSGGAQFALIEAQSNVVTVEHPNYPSGLHLALAKSDRSATIRVAWTTKNASAPVVRYGLKPNALTLTATATSSTYSPADMCAEPAKSRGWIDPGTLHNAILSDLTPGAEYYYTVGDAASSTAADWSDVSNFVAPNASDDDTLFLVFGDMGNAPIDGSSQHSWDYGNRGEINSLNTTAGLLYAVTHAPKRPAAVVHFGDISYAVGFEAEWDQFQEQIRPIASRVPWMASIGNHEMGDVNSFVPGTDSGGECGVPFVRRFVMPAPADNPQPTTPWFTFQSGLVTFVMMSTEHDYSVGTAQHTFLTNALRAVDRSVTPWLVFTGHRPMYVDSTWAEGPYSDQGYATNLRATIEPLLAAAKVDLALWGHHHSYQRTCSVFNGTCVSQGTVHAVIGTAGYELTKNFFPTTPAYFHYVNNAFWGYGQLRATRNNLTLQWVENETNQILDQVVLTRRQH